VTRAWGRAVAAGIATAAALFFGVIACAVEKKGNTVGADTARATPSPAPTSAADTTTGQPVTSTGSATADDSSKSPRKPAPGVTAKTTPAGGERDSAAPAVFEIGADGKVQRVKR
jgi:hypothetical protein